MVEDARLAEEQRIRAIEDEKMVVRVTGFPARQETGAWMVAYAYDSRTNSGPLHLKSASAGECVLKGPNKSGGDLIVSYESLTEQKIYPWLYVENVQSRQVTLPQDATFVIHESELVEINLVLKGPCKEILPRYNFLNFCTRPEASFGLFWVAWYPDRLTEWESSGWQGKVKAVPGQYHIRLRREKKTLPLGALDISDEPGRTYTITLPEGEGSFFP